MSRISVDEESRERDRQTEGGREASDTFFDTKMKFVSSLSFSLLALRTLLFSHVTCDATSGSQRKREREREREREERREKT